MRCTSSIEIQAPPDRVFFWINDPEQVMKWVPNIVENEIVEEKPGHVGTSVRQVYEEHGRRMEFHGTVTRHEENRSLGMNLQGDMFDLEVNYELEDLGGRTRVTQHAEVRFKGFMMRILGPIMSFFTKKSSNRTLQESFERLRDHCESGPENAEDH